VMSVQFRTHREGCGINYGPC